MSTSLAARLAGLDLGHLSVRRFENTATHAPPEEAVEHTLGAIWSELFALFPETVLEDDAEEIAWGMVNLFHRAATKRMGQLDRATDEIRCLVASADGSEVHTVELEEQVARAQRAEAAMIGLESFRECAAVHYARETGSSWRPATGSRLNHSSQMTSALVEGRAFLRARAESRCKAAMPQGTPVVFAGGRLAFANNAEAKACGDSVWVTLDKVRERVADMVLVHGGDTKALDRLAAAWAESRKVAQVAFGLETRLGRRAGFRRNEQMLGLKPRYLVAFAGNGVLERLVIDAKRQGIAVVDRRGPLGTHPGRAFGSDGAAAEMARAGAH